jgi:polyisoprenoid-binding protein YceI
LRGHPHRATQDIDLLGFGTPDVARLTATFREICAVAVEDDGVTFDASSVTAVRIREDASYEGLRVRFKGQLGSATLAMQVDVGFGDAITPAPVSAAFPVLLDFPAPALRIYPRETVVAEKLEAMVHLGIANSRMKDFFDIDFLARSFEFDGAESPRQGSPSRVTITAKGLSVRLRQDRQPDVSGSNSRRSMRTSERLFMRHASLVVLALLSVPACEARDTTSARAAATGVAATAGAASTAPDEPAVPAPAVPQVSKWVLDPENSSVGFVCKHVLSNVRGMFAKPSGTVTLDEATPANSRVDATIDASSVTTGVEERDTHLKSADFFNVAEYPTIAFVSSSVTKSSATSYSVTGDLTMHGVTKPVTLAFTASAPFDHAGSIRRGIEAITSVNRKDFGLVWEYPGEGPGIVVGDNIKITVDAELVLQAD